jgi:hypothetical protein
MGGRAPSFRTMILRIVCKLVPNQPQSHPFSCYPQLSYLSHRNLVHIEACMTRAFLPAGILHIRPHFFTIRLENQGPTSHNSQPGWMGVLCTSNTPTSNFQCPRPLSPLSRHHIDPTKTHTDGQTQTHKRSMLWLVIYKSNFFPSQKEKQIPPIHGSPQSISKVRRTPPIHP